MKVTLLSPEKGQYKANLHCHSTRSDGKMSPTELKALYKENGYRILAITDHCRPTDHTAESDEDLLLLTGYEAYIRPAGHNRFSPEIHMNLFPKDPHNVRFIGYDPAYIKYIPKEEWDAIDRAENLGPREDTVEYINRFIESARKNGYLVTYNHPLWSMEDEERIMSYEGIFSLEIYNTSSYVLNDLENAEPLYDAMLRRGKRIFCHGADDNHSSADCCGYHTMILADALTHGDVYGALESGDFYASSGARITEITASTDGDDLQIHIGCSPATAVFVYFGSKYPARVRLEPGRSDTAFDLSIPAGVSYFRVSVDGADGSRAVSRGYFNDEWNKEDEA